MTLLYIGPGVGPPSPWPDSEAVLALVVWITLCVLVGSVILYGAWNSMERLVRSAREGLLPSAHPATLIFALTASHTAGDLVAQIPLESQYPRDTSL